MKKKSRKRKLDRIVEHIIREKITKKKKVPKKNWVYVPHISHIFPIN